MKVRVTLAVIKINNFGNFEHFVCLYKYSYLVNRYLLFLFLLLCEQFSPFPHLSAPGLNQTRLLMLS